MKLMIVNTEIRKDDQGRFCLNDLHRAAGGEDKHRPTYYLKLMSTMALIEEMEKDGIPSIDTKQGVGSFVAKELVYGYAMWISPSFHLKVIRTFDAISTQSAPVIHNPERRAMIQLLTEVDALDNRISLLEAKTTTRDESYFTAAGYCNLKGIRLDRAGMAMIGKMAASYSRDNSLKIGKVYDSRYGEVNEYHTSALQYAVEA